MKIQKELKVQTRDELGINILDGIMPNVTRLDGVDEELTIRVASPIKDPNYINYITQDSSFNTHIDIDGTAFSLLYDLGEEQDIEKIYFACYKKPFSVGEVEIYASNSREDIFKKESLIIEIDNRNDDALCEAHRTQSALFNTEDLSCRYIGFIQKSTNATDGISRIKNFGVYNKKYSQSRIFIRDNYEGSCLQGAIANVQGEYSGNLSWLTDAAVFGGEKCVKLNNARLSFTLPFNKKIDELVLIGSKVKNLEIGADSSELVKASYIEEETQIGTIYTIDTSSLKKTNKLLLKLSGCVDEVLAFCRGLDIEVNWNEIINKDFLGLGANVLPTHLFEIGRMQGFTDAHMQLEKRRIAVMHPSIVRMWFQIDWFIMDKEDYYNRKYTFNSPKMKAVFKELDAYKEAGVLVEFNFGWKVGYSAVEWFCFPDVFNKRNSAPRDIDQFAIACVDCLRELIINRGYDNIKYLSFYNESNNGLYDDGWDFVCPKGMHPMDYWVEMLKKVNSRLKQENMQGVIDIWAAEVVGNPEKWAAFYNEKAPDQYTNFTFHQYGASYTNAYHWGRGVIEAAGNHPVCTTEFGTYDPKDFKIDDFDFEWNNIAGLMGNINAGISAVLYWVLSGSVVDEGFINNDDQGNFWKMPTNQNPISLGNEPFYKLSLFSNYIPIHSKIYKAETGDKGMHIVVAETASGDVTIAVDLKATIKGKELNIDFKKYIGKKFYKHVYTLGKEHEANLIVPPCVAEFDVEQELTDKIDANYCFVMYTTIPPIRQVVMDEVFTETKFGEPLQLGAKIIDGDGEIKWSIVDCNRTYYLEADVSQEGVFKTSHDYFRTTVGLPCFAVKAELPTGEYGITIVKVTK